jgi:hypothetical protein
VDRFARPDPNAGRYSHDHVHEILYHKNRKQGMGVFADALRTWHRIILFVAHVVTPRDHPIVEIELFVKQTSNDYHCGYGVQYGKNADADHEFFQFVGFCTVVFHHGTNPEERYQTGS